MRALPPLRPLAAATALFPLGAATATFFPTHLAPGDPETAILLVDLSPDTPGDALVERLAARRADR